MFHFKQFSIQQEKTPMKVGTDAIVLGSWVKVNQEEMILDIGTGTGILALMLAQRSDAMSIDAVEIDENAYEEAVENFENSPWSDRLFCYHTSIQSFVAEIDENYDLIVCNPPYFPPSKIESYNGRKVAREMHLLNHITLLKNVKKLLSENGNCAFCLPYESEKLFVEIAENMGLHLQKIMRMKDKFDSQFTRSFLQFGFNKQILKEEVLILKEENNSYTKQFQELTKEFYTIF